MKTCIKAINAQLDAHPRLKEWLWFAILWLGGLATVTALAYPIKLLIRNMQ